MTSLTRLPLNTLPTFRAAARLQNLRAAATQLHLTHSAVSQQLKQLETHLGLALFERRGRGVVLNAAGQALLDAVEAALDGLSQGVQAAQAAASGQVQLLRLSVLPSFAQRWLLPRIARWRARHPEITLEVHASHQVVDLRREGFHAALRAGRGPWPGLSAEPLVDSPLFAVAAPQRAARLPAGDAATVAAAVAAEPLLGATELWRRYLALAGVVLRAQTVADFNDAGLLVQAAEADLGVALAREVLARDALRAGRLVRVLPLRLDDERWATYWLVHPPERAAWPPLLALRRWLAEELAEEPVHAPAHQDDGVGAPSIN